MLQCYTRITNKIQVKYNTQSMKLAAMSPTGMADEVIFLIFSHKKTIPVE